MKSFVIAVAFGFALLRGCGGNPQPYVPPAPSPSPSPSPVASVSVVSTPTPTPTPASDTLSLPVPSPVPTPVVNVADYFPVYQGTTVTISTQPGDDLGQLLTAASVRTTSGPIVLSGGGDFKTRGFVTSNHNLKFTNGLYTFSVPDTDHGQVIMADGTTVEGDSTATLQEPTFNNGSVGAISIFQVEGDYRSSGHQGRAANIGIRGIHVVGAQTVYDGGARSTFTLANCHHCAVVDSTLEKIMSIGMDIGGSSAAGEHADDVVILNNTIRGNGAAGIAPVNATNVIIMGNKCYDQGHEGAGGGTSCIDVEPNSGADYALHIRIMNNYVNDLGGIRYGNAVDIQNPYDAGPDHNGDILIAGNQFINEDYSQPMIKKGTMSAAIFIAGRAGNSFITQNVIRGSGQQGFQLYHANGWNITDNDIADCGGGGMYGVLIYDTTDLIWQRNLMHVASPVNQQPDWTWIIRCRSPLAGPKFQQTSGKVVDQCFPGT